MQDEVMDFLEELFAEELKRRPKRWMNVPDGFSAKDLRELKTHPVNTVKPTGKGLDNLKNKQCELCADNKTCDFLDCPYF